MVNVIAWPPIGAIGRDFTTERPISVSRSLLTGKRYVSAAQSARRVATLQASGIGPDLAGAGYVEMLKDQLDGGINLVRVNTTSQAWYLASCDLKRLRGRRVLDLVTGEYDLDVTSGGNPLAIYVGVEITATAATIEGNPVLNCTGLPANRPVAFPSETVRIKDVAGDFHTARVLRVSRANAAGAAVIYLDAALPDGEALIGFQESVAFSVENVNQLRAIQPVNGDWTYTFQLREVFEAETDGFVEVNPWR